jgi:hypothetical protein
LIAVWTQAGKHRLGGGGQHAPHMHGRYGSRGCRNPAEAIYSPLGGPVPAPGVPKRKSRSGLRF